MSTKAIPRQLQPSRFGSFANRYLKLSFLHRTLLNINYWIRERPYEKQYKHSLSYHLTQTWNCLKWSCMGFNVRNIMFNCTFCAGEMSVQRWMCCELVQAKHQTIIQDIQPSRSVNTGSSSSIQIVVTIILHWMEDKKWKRGRGWGSQNNYGR